MGSANLAEIEEQVSRLSREEQLWLIEQLAHRLRQSAATQSAPAEVAPEVVASQLAAMAADPDIQRELRAIEHEFSGTEMDGLERF